MEEQLEENYVGMVIVSHACITWNRTWLYRLPQSKIIMYSLIWCTATVYKIKEISSSALELTTMTPCKCHADRLVPDHNGGRPKQINAWFLYTHMVYL
jgi:hypothetical protein